MDINNIITSLEAKHPGEKEYLQAVREVLLSVADVYNQHPEFEKAKIIERMVEPDRIVTFRVTWIDDKGEVQTNIGYRVQFNNAIGPYKGGIRFHASRLPLSEGLVYAIVCVFMVCVCGSFCGKEQGWIPTMH